MTSDPAPDPSAPRQWLRGVPVGARVVVRYLIEDGDRATDVLGELLDRGSGTLTVRGRHGEVTVRLADVVAAKPVPPAPATRRLR